MALRISIPLRVVGVLLLLAAAWGGAAVIAFGFSYWLDDEGLAQEDLNGYATVDDLRNYATKGDLATMRGELSSIRAESLQLTTGPGSALRLAVADMLLRDTARGDLPPAVIKAAFFPSANSADFDICVASYPSEACARVEEAAFVYPPE